MRQKPRYFTRDEVVVHNSHDDIWIIVNGRIFDLTNLCCCQEQMSNNMKLLLAYAGKDLSCYFNKENSPLYRINQYGESVPIFLPVIIDNWWCDESKIIGCVTCLERQVRIINTLTHKTTMMNVCEEDSINTIKEKLRTILDYNTDNYVWRKKSSSSANPISGQLFMSKTLTQNGLFYHENEKFGLPSAIWLYHKF